MNYNWNRRWVLPGMRETQAHNLSTLAQRWFSANHPASRNSFSLDDLADIPVIILLGEPGIGKTSEITDYFERARQTNNEHIWELQEYPPTDFNQFFNQLQSQIQSGEQRTLVVFIDAFDESQHSPVNLGRNLVAALKATPMLLDKLYLRVACRTADWSEDTTSRLKSLFGQGNVLTIELDALGQQEVVQAAKAHEINVYKFLELIEQNALATLTLKPITLIDLLRQYKTSDGVLPPTRNALYEKMCRQLCEEHNQYHDENDRRGNFTVDELFTESARLATIMLTTRRLAIWIPSSTKDIPDGSVAIGDLHHGTSAEDRLTRAALHTGFFSSRGPNQLGWAHLSYAEYLAAFYMQNNLSLPQIKSLLVHPNDNKIIPQLREVAAWLTTMNPVLLQFIADFDPETLFQSDLIVEDTNAREQLTSIFLDLYHREILIDSYNSHARYRRFMHPRLSEQLTNFVRDNSRNDTSRYVAISIIHACELRDSADNLVDLALNSNLDFQLQVHSAYVIARIGSSAARLALKPLVLGDARDINDELKGAGLIATWPEHLTTPELFKALTPRKRENFGGNYHMFLRKEILDDVALKDLPLALNWAADFIENNTDIHHDIDYIIQEIIDEIVYRSWSNFDTSGVCEALGKLILAKIAHYHPLFGTDRSKLEGHHQSVVDELVRDEAKRHRLLIEVINLINKSDFSYHALNYRIPLLLDTDIVWLLSLLEEVNGPISKDALLDLIGVVFRRWDPNHMSIMAQEIEHNEFLREKFGKWFYVALNSTYADELRQAHEREQERTAKYQAMDNDRQNQLIEPPPLIRLEEVLIQCEQGEIKEWWQTNIWLAANEYGRYRDEYDNIRQMPIWEQIDQITKERIISLGIQFILNASPETEKWLGKYVFWRPALAAYRMIFLLFDAGAKIPVDVLEKWTPAIITFPDHFVRTEHQRHNQFLAMVYENNRLGFRSWLKQFLEHWHNPNLDIVIVENKLSRFDTFFDDSIAGVLLEYLDHPQIKPTHYMAILNFLLRKHVPEACSRAASDFHKLYNRHSIMLQQIPLLCSLQANHTASKLHLAKLVQVKLREAEDDRMASARLAASLIASPVQGDWWHSIWAVIQMDENFGRKIIEVTAESYDDRRTAKIGSHIAENEVADLYLWTAERYPHHEDPDFLGEGRMAQVVTPRHNVADWRDSLLNQLAERGTFEALKELNRIGEVYPDLYQLKRLRKYIIEQLYKNTWHPPQIDSVLSLFQNKEQRLVQTDNQLFDVVIESLGRLQKRLQGETPSAADLWNIVSTENICRPKDESALSNYIKRHLEQDLKERGIVINREVEIRQKEGREGAAPGEIPDIYVSAISPNSNKNEMKQLIVLIEVKGNWHSELKTALQTQLVERYLRDNDRATCGLYLVGWFNCPQWDRRDYRRDIAFQDNFDGLHDKLKAQADNLSNDLLNVRAFVLDVSLRSDTV